MAFQYVMCLCVLTCIFFFFANSLSAEPSENVKLDLYYETLDHGCADFMMNDLTKIYDYDLIDYVDINFIPYGNAKHDANGNITCENGEEECLLNVVEACVIHGWQDKFKQFKFLRCIASWVYVERTSEWERCYRHTGITARGLADCLETQWGNELMLQNANKTDCLVPPHRYLPWIVVNGNPVEEKYPVIITAICQAYKGTPKPWACQ